jgi:hypothetical protein
MCGEIARVTMKVEITSHHVIATAVIENKIFSNLAFHNM